MRHPIADLLDDEMRARLRAADFRLIDVLNHNGKTYACVRGATGVCPIGVALGLDASPTVRAAARILGEEHERALFDFMVQVDTGRVTAAEVLALLGCADE